MDTKSRIIEIATALFQQKGYIGVGLNEILKAGNLSKGSLYHHFPNGKEELLIACLKTLNDSITQDVEEIFHLHWATGDALNAMVDRLINHFETDGTFTGYTFSSIVSEMALLSDSIRDACNELYFKLEDVYQKKLMENGVPSEEASALALIITATVEGGMMLCLAQKSSEPLRTIAKGLPTLIKGV